MTGTVKKKTDRGFGFISVEGQEKDLFFHSTAIVAPLTFDELSEGATVSFDVATGDDGRQSAKNVTLAQQGAQEEKSEPAEESVSTEENAPDEESAPVEETTPAEEN